MVTFFTKGRCHRDGIAKFKGTTFTGGRRAQGGADSIHDDLTQARDAKSAIGGGVVHPIFNAAVVGIDTGIIQGQSTCGGIAFLRRCSGKRGWWCRLLRGSWRTPTPNRRE